MSKNKSKELTPAEQEYEKIVASVVFKDRHVAPEPKEGWLYTLTTRSKSRIYGGNRTVMIANSFEKADKIIRENGDFFWEFSCNLAVIEAVAVDRIYGFTPDQGLRPAFWYCWAPEGNSLEEGTGEGEFKPIETPELYRKSFGWGIG